MSSSTPTPKTSDAPAWTRRAGDSEAVWRTTERDQGGAYRGVPRNRGRGGGAPRGRPNGRGGGGGGAAATGRGVSSRGPGTPDCSQSTPPPLPGKTAGVGGGPQAKNSAPPRRRDVPKVPSRPDLVGAGNPQSSDSMTSPLSPGRPTRRPRRNTHKRAVSDALPKPIPTTLTDGLPISPSTPLVSSTKDVKEPPSQVDQSTNSNPHVHDLRQEITSLVERVRTMAMDGNRPKSPSTHIDWAGDDDDSLPDLDDWGISSKLASDVGETSAKLTSEPEPVVQTLPDSTSAPALEKAELKDQIVVVPPAIDGAHSSAESPTESSMSMSQSAPHLPVKRTRERKRGGRRDKEKKLLALQSNRSINKPTPSSTAPKKSLLERISSPVRPEPPSLPQESAPLPAPTTLERTVTASKSEPNVLARSSLPLKPPSLPKKPVSPSRPIESWRNRQPDRSHPKEDKPPSPVAEPAVVEAVSGEAQGGAEKVADVPPSEERKEEIAPVISSSSFDWSEEPVSFDPTTEPPNGPAVDIEPPTPSTTVNPATPEVPPPSSSPLLPDTTDTKSNASTNTSPRFRSQRPLSGDVTPTHRAARRERSPYKSHTPRNHSMPHVGPGSGSGSGSGTSPSPSPVLIRQPRPQPHLYPRPQHASRPIIRMDALAMISRSLRESPPPRRDSPPVTKVAES